MHRRLAPSAVYSNHLSRRQWLQTTVLGGATLLLPSDDSLGLPNVPWYVGSPAHRRRRGQWIWSSADADLFDAIRRDQVAFEAAVLIASVGIEGSTVRAARGLSPRRLGSLARCAVVRLQDELHALWSSQSPSRVYDLLMHAIAPVLRSLRDDFSQIREFQLDYDVPNRRLPAFAEVVQRLRHQLPAKTELWITSIPAHLQHPGFGELFGRSVAGHVIQLFDTGLVAHLDAARAIRSALVRHSLIFRYGIGTFERVRGAGRTDHRSWLRLAQSCFGGLDNCAGYWLFPAGQPYAHWLACSDPWSAPCRAMDLP